MYTSCPIGSHHKSSVAEAIYSKVPGADLVKNSPLGGDVWTIPCDVEINIAFKFGGKNFPIHPLDTSLDLNATDDSGHRICIGAVSSFIPCLCIFD